MTELSMLEKLLERMYIDPGVHPNWIHFDYELALSLDNDEKTKYAEILSDCWSIALDRDRRHLTKEEILKRFEDVVLASKVCCCTYPLSLLEVRLAKLVSEEDVDVISQQIRDEMISSPPDVQQALRNLLIELGANPSGNEFR